MITVLDTPNPDTKKFSFDRDIVSSGTKEIKKGEKSNIAFVDSLFGTSGIDLVFIDKNFISIKKSQNVDWNNLSPKVLEILNNNIGSKFEKMSFEETEKFSDDISKRIEEVLTEKIRPAVAMDGGDIRLKSFSNGIAEVILQGACAGCPSSTVTLKHGVERMIKHYVPEVNSVEAVNLDE